MSNTVTYEKDGRSIFVDEGSALEGRVVKDGWTKVEPESLAQAQAELASAQAAEKAAEAREPSAQAKIEAAARLAAAQKAAATKTKMTK